MFRLILAELKKVIYNKLTMIGISSVIIITIAVFTVIYAQSSYILYSRYSPQLEEINGGSGFDVAIKIINNMDDKNGEITWALQNVESIKNNNIKNELKDNVNLLLNYNKEINDILFSMEPYLITSDITKAYLDEIFGQPGQDYNHIDELRAVFVGIHNTLAKIDNIINYVYFRKDDYIKYNYYYFPNDFREKYFFEYYSRLNSFYNYRLNYYNIVSEGGDFTSIKSAMSNLPEQINQIIYKKRDLLNSKLLKDFISAINNALSMNVTEETYKYLNDFIAEGENSVYARLEQYGEEAYEYLEVNVITEDDAHALAMLKHRHNNMIKRIKIYVEKFILYKNFESFTDDYLDNFQIASMRKKYEMKKYLTATEFTVKNDMHFSDYDINSADMVAEGYYPASKPLSLTGILSDTMYKDLYPTDIYTYMRSVFSVLSIVIVTICIFLGGSMVAGEQSSGTIKMLMIRPYKRWKILTAKILSTIIISFCLILLSFIILFITGTIMGFGMTSCNVMSVFNASQTVIMSSFAELILQILYMLINLIVYTIIATFFSAALKAKTAAVTIVLILNFAGAMLGQIMKNYQLFKYLIFTNTELYIYYGGGSVFNDMTFVFSALMCVLYSLIIGFATYCIFNKKDLN